MAVRYEGSDETPRHIPFLRFAREHVTLLASVVAALVFAIRLVAVAQGDAYTASIVLAHTSLGDAIRTLLLDMVPLLMGVLSFGAAYVAGTREGWFDLGTLGLLVTSITAMAIQLYLSGSFFIADDLSPDWWHRLLLFSAYPLMLFYMTYRANSIRRRGYYSDLGLPRWIQQILVAGLVLAFLSAAVPKSVSRNFWLPRERLVFTGEAPFTGYVLRTREDHLVIMNDDPRIIIEKPKVALRERDFCYSEDYEKAFKEAGRVMRTCP